LKSGNVENATRVLVRFIKNKHVQKKPNAATIDMVMREWIKRGNLKQATLLVDQMQGLKDSNFLSEGPDRSMYSALLKAWKKSDHAEKAMFMKKLEGRLGELKSAKST